MGRLGKQSSFPLSPQSVWRWRAAVDEALEHSTARRIDLRRTPIRHDEISNKNLVKITFLIWAPAAERKFFPPAVIRYYPQRTSCSGLMWIHLRTERWPASRLTGPGIVSTTMPESSWDFGPGVIWSPLCCSLIYGKIYFSLKKISKSGDEFILEVSDRQTRTTTSDSLLTQHEEMAKNINWKKKRLLWRKLCRLLKK